MYESFFQFRQRPFLAAPRADRYFPAEAAEQARLTLTRSIERAEGPGLLFGAAGLGKSLVFQVLAEQLQGSFQVAQLNCAQLCTRRALLQAILYELGLPYREREEGALRLTLIDHLSDDQRAGAGLLLLVDEAHLMPLRLLEELRMISNLLRDGQPRVRLVLAGLPSLEERFASPRLASFSQRVAARCYLASLTSAETQEYVRSQVAAALAGDSPADKGTVARSPFADDALVAIYRTTDGVPRLINQVCDHALLLAWAGGVRRIGADGIEEAWADLQQLPLRRPAHNEHDAVGPAVIEFGSLDDDMPVRFADHAARELGERQAIPFPGRPFPERDALDEFDLHELAAEDRLDEIAGRLAELDDDFAPIGTIGPEVELIIERAANPFAESFADEEVVIDRYASLDDAFLRSRPRVVDRSRDRLGDRLSHGIASGPELDPDLVVAELEFKSSPRRAAASRGQADPVLPEMAPTRVPQRGAVAAEAPLIVVEDEPSAAPKVRRQEYRQLFARLRQIS